MSKARGLHIQTDIVRTVAIVCVILLHAANDLTTQQMGQLEIFRWVTVDIYQSVGRMGVLLFLILTGALLLQPSKLDEPIGVFFKKRWARIGLPFVFWGVIFFVWDFAVLHQPITSSAIVQGILTGPYYHFWYLYMLTGIYLLTPILRIVMAHANQTIIKYFIVLWLLGASIVPVASLVTTYYLDPNVLAFTGYAGFFVLGAYLLNVKMRRSTLLVLMGLGLALTVVGTYAIAATVGGVEMYFFQQYLSPTLILASVTLFLLLNTIRVPSIKPKDQLSEENKSAKGHAKIRILLSLISENTLPIFLFHIIILESLQNGYFGFAINGNTINSIIGVPIVTVITLFLSLAFILPLKKIPVLKSLIG